MGEDFLSTLIRIVHDSMQSFSVGTELVRKLFSFSTIFFFVWIYIKNYSYISLVLKFEIEIVVSNDSVTIPVWSLAGDWQFFI